jgi:type II secretory pathway pseudopilin PulG
MKRSARSTAAFSLVELTLALGVAAFCLLAIFGMLPVALKTQQASIQQTTANEIISEISDELRAAARLPSGIAKKLNTADPQQNKTWTLNQHWFKIENPDWLYYTVDGEWTGGISPSPAPSDAAFIALINYSKPPSDTTSLAIIVVSWPATAVNTSTGTGTPIGSVQAMVAVNR